MIRLERFGEHDFDNLIKWLDSEELLVQIAGRQMAFPVTKEQLEISQQDTKRISFSIISTESGLSVGHCELYLDGDTAKIDRVLIGEPAMKGKGLCKELMALLLDYGFHKLNLSTVELNVFDWNVSAIRCYERSGMVRNIDKFMKFEMDGKVWTAVNMSISKEEYMRG